MSPIPVYLFTTIFSSYTVVLDKNFGSSRKLGFYKRPWPKAGAGRSQAGAVNISLGLMFLSLGRPEPGQAGLVTSLTPRRVWCHSSYWHRPTIFKRSSTQFQRSFHLPTSHKWTISQHFCNRFMPFKAKKNLCFILST